MCRLIQPTIRARCKSLEREFFKKDFQALSSTPLINLEVALKPFDQAHCTPASDGFSVFVQGAPPLTLAALCVGARLIVKCKRDWRTASVSRVGETHVVINVHSPKGGTYRIRRPLDTILQTDGAIPLLRATDAECERASWLSGLADYDARW